MQVKRDRPGGGRRAGQEKITENKTWARKGSRDSIKALLEGSLNTCHPSRCLTCVRTMFLPYMSADIVRWIHAKPDATKRGRPNTEKQRSLRAAWQSETDSTYPKGTFEELLVIAVNWCKYLQELQDALLIIKVGYLLKCLLNQFSKRFSLHKKWKKYTQLNSKQSAHLSTVYIVQCTDLQSGFCWRTCGSAGITITASHVNFLISYVTNTKQTDGREKYIKEDHSAI